MRKSAGPCIEREVSASIARSTSTTCGELTDGIGVGLRWPDGVVTEAIASTVTGLTNGPSS